MARHRLPARPIAASLAILAFAASASGAERPWESRMVEFEHQDAEQPSEPGGVVFVGSSSIRLWDLPKYFGAGAPTEIEGPLVNRGFGGSHLSHSVDQIDLLVLRHRPRLVVVYAGDNDISAGKSAERVATDFDRLNEAVREALPDTTIAYVAIKPSLARWPLADAMADANRRIARRCAADPRLVFIDIWAPMLGADGRPRAELFADDGLHLSEAGYEVWARAVRKSVSRR